MHRIYLSMCKMLSHINTSVLLLILCFRLSPQFQAPISYSPCTFQGTDILQVVQQSRTENDRFSIDKTGITYSLTRHTTWIAAYVPSATINTTHHTNTCLCNKVFGDCDRQQHGSKFCFCTFVVKNYLLKHFLNSNLFSSHQPSTMFSGKNEIVWVQKGFKDLIACGNTISRLIILSKEWSTCCSVSPSLYWSEAICVLT